MEWNACSIQSSASEVRTMQANQRPQKIARENVPIYCNKSSLCRALKSCSSVLNSLTHCRSGELFLWKLHSCRGMSLVLCNIVLKKHYYMYVGTISYCTCKKGINFQMRHRQGPRLTLVSPKASWLGNLTIEADRFVHWQLWATAPLH